MHIEQFVMAYSVEQDRIRALLPEGFISLRPVLRINSEIKDDSIVYVEFNTPVEREGKRGWLNIANWSSENDNIFFVRYENEVEISSPFLKVKYAGIGIEGGCPAEIDNDGCFYFSRTDINFKQAEIITENKEFCDCAFSWSFHPDNAHGASIGKTLPAFCEEIKIKYDRLAFNAENAAAIPCRQVLGSYIVRFER